MIKFDYYREYVPSFNDFMEGLCCRLKTAHLDQSEIHSIKWGEGPEFRGQPTEVLEVIDDVGTSVYLTLEGQFEELRERQITVLKGKLANASEYAEIFTDEPGSPDKPSSVDKKVSFAFFYSFNPETKEQQWPNGLRIYKEKKVELLASDITYIRYGEGPSRPGGATDAIEINLRNGPMTVYVTPAYQYQKISKQHPNPQICQRLDPYEIYTRFLKTIQD